MLQAPPRSLEVVADRAAVEDRRSAAVAAAVAVVAALEVAVENQQACCSIPEARREWLAATLHD